MRELKLLGICGSLRRQSTNARVVSRPPQERLWGARLLWKTASTATRLGWMRREGWQQTDAWLLSHEQRLDNRLALTAELGWHQPSEESLALRLAGMKNHASLALRYQFSRLDSVLWDYRAEDYYLQTGHWLGSGRHTELRYTHTYRQDLPHLEFSAFGSYHGYRINQDAMGWPSLDFLPPGALEGPRTFVARSFAFYGLEASSNTRLEQDYTRALQPFASVSRTWHSRLGPGYGVRLGLAGSLLGADHFSIAWGLSKSGLQSQDRSSEWQLRYRLPF